MNRKILALALAIITFAGIFTMAPLWAPLLLATWTAELMRPLARRLERFSARPVAAAIVIVLLVIVLVPLSFAVASLVVAGLDAWHQVSSRPEVQGSLLALVSDGGGSGGDTLQLFDPQHLIQVVREHGAVLWGVASTFAGATLGALIAVFVYVVSTFAFLAGGEADWTWIVQRSPLSPGVMERLRGAFHETGRGIIIGHGLTALAQAAVMGIFLVAIGVPRALVLAEVTFFASFLPTLGTAAVWIPVAIGLALADHLVKAAIMAGFGVVVVGGLDNVLRPALARWGKLELPVYLQILSVFGGIAAFGAWGFLLGPLLIRMAKEALNIVADEGLNR